MIIMKIASEGTQQKKIVPYQNQQKQINYLLTGEAVESLDGEPIDFSNMEIKTIESNLMRHCKRNPKVWKTQTIRK